MRAAAFVECGVRVYETLLYSSPKKWIICADLLFYLYLYTGFLGHCHSYSVSTSHPQLELKRRYVQDLF